jgi:hypothetical protein
MWSTALVPPSSGPRGSVITIGVSDSDLALVDSLVEAGVYKTRREAAAWLLHAGIEGKRALLARAPGAESVWRAASTYGPRPNACSSSSSSLLH